MTIILETSLVFEGPVSSVGKTSQFWYKGASKGHLQLGELVTLD